MFQKKPTKGFSSLCKLIKKTILTWKCPNSTLFKANQFWNFFLFFFISIHSFVAGECSQSLEDSVMDEVTDLKRDFAKKEGEAQILSYKLNVSFHLEYLFRPHLLLTYLLSWQNFFTILCSWQIQIGCVFSCQFPDSCCFILLPLTFCLFYLHLDIVCTDNDIQYVLRTFIMFYWLASCSTDMQHVLLKFIIFYWHLSG